MVFIGVVASFFLHSTSFNRCSRITIYAYSTTAERELLLKIAVNPMTSEPQCNVW